MADEIARLVEILKRGPTPEDQQREALSFESYRSFAAGVEWGATHGRGEWDDAEQAWDGWGANRPGSDF